jgi:hypothetical protein
MKRKLNSPELFGGVTRLKTGRVKSFRFLEKSSFIVPWRKCLELLRRKSFAERKLKTKGEKIANLKLFAHPKN